MAKRVKTVKVDWTLEDFPFDEKFYDVELTITLVVESDHFELDGVKITDVSPLNSDEYRVAIAVENYIEYEAANNGSEAWQSIVEYAAEKVANGSD